MSDWFAWLALVVAVLVFLRGEYLIRSERKRRRRESQEKLTAAGWPYGAETRGARRG